MFGTCALIKCKPEFLNPDVPGLDGNTVCVSFTDVGNRVYYTTKDRKDWDAPVEYFERVAFDPTPEELMEYISTLKQRTK